MKSANLLNGRWVSDADTYFDNLNPADLTSRVSEVPVMSAGSVVDACHAAHEAFGMWRRVSPIERGEILLRAGILLRERQESVARQITLEMGKTLREAMGEVAGAANFLLYYSSFGRQQSGYRLPYSTGGVEAFVRREPIGVIGAISPFNDPLLTSARKVAPALISGNTAVLKVPSDSPNAALALALALDDAGLPAGVLNTVSGEASVVGGALLSSSLIAGVSFTGSTRAGRGIERLLAGTGIRSQTEMGGKNGAIVLTDADIPHAARTVVDAAFAQAGQRCTATSRVVVAQSVFDAFMAAIEGLVRAIHVGAGIDPTTDMGPVASQTRMEKVLSAISAARESGAELVTGGCRLTDDPLKNGCFVAPTVLLCDSTDSPLWQEEVFGPVLAIYRANDEADARRALVDTRYGLSASVFTARLEAAYEFAEDVETGQIAVNLPTSGWDVHLPFGGFGESGSSFKEQGAEGLAFYTRVKTVAVRHAIQAG